MNSAIFKEWFQVEFIPIVEKYTKENGLSRKALLFVDNAPSHPDDLQDGDMKVIFLLPNVTFLCQPMDQGVLEAIRKYYRSKLLEYFIGAIDVKENCAQSFEKSVS